MLLKLVKNRVLRKTGDYCRPGAPEESLSVWELISRPVNSSQDGSSFGGAVDCGNGVI